MSGKGERERRERTKRGKVLKEERGCRREAKRWFEEEKRMNSVKGGNGKGEKGKEENGNRGMAKEIIREE